MSPRFSHELPCLPLWLSPAMAVFLVRWIKVVVSMSCHFKESLPKCKAILSYHQWFQFIIKTRLQNLCYCLHFKASSDCFKRHVHYINITGQTWRLYIFVKCRSTLSYRKSFYFQWPSVDLCYFSFQVLYSLK